MHRFQGPVAPWIAPPTRKAPTCQRDAFAKRATAEPLRTGGMRWWDAMVGDETLEATNRHKNTVFDGELM
jgi:hypothetical protein